jgi:hypothetical protein
MNRSRDILPVAQKLMEELGEEGPTVISERAEALRQAGELDAAQFWEAVFRAMQSFAA